MAAKTPPTKKSKASAKQPAKSRQLKQGSYKSFRLSKQVKHQRPKVAGSIKLVRLSLQHLRKYWKPFFGIVLIYLILTIVMVKGFGVSLGIGDLKTTLHEAFNGATGSVVTGFTLFTVLLTSSGSTTNDAAGIYQTILAITVSLAIIWALRQSYAGSKITAKDAFYKGIYPLVPFVLVLLVIGLQLLPLVVGSWLYGTVITGGVAATVLEKLIWIILVLLLALLSLYMVSSSVFALYIVTLPDMTPMKALRSAREIVRYRRWLVMRKVIALPIVLLILGAVIVVPLIIFITPLAEWVFFVLNMAVLAIIHSYMYTLYRELL